jgi:transcription antitermination factor NusG
MIQLQDYWAIACVMSGQEFKFRDRIIEAQASAGAYVPSKRSMCTSRRQRKPITITTPAFSRYVFVHVERGDLPRRLLDRTLVDYRMMTVDRELVCIPPSEIARVRQLELSGVFDAMPTDVTLEFSAGTVVFVTNGVFATRTGRVIQRPRMGSKMVTVDFFGRTVKMPLDFLRVSH